MGPISPTRRCRLSSLLVLFLLSLSLSPSTSTLINTRVFHVIDATADVARVQAQVRVRNAGSAPVSEVRILAPSGAGAISVCAGEKLTRSGMLQGRSRPDGHYAFLREPLFAGYEIVLVVAYDIVSAIAPSPAELPEGSSHFVRLRCGAHFLSPYHTEVASTTLRLARKPNGGVVDAPGPVDVDGSVVKIGPFVDVPAGSVSEEVSVRFQNDRGMLVAKEYTREMYVSHWGNVAVREEYVVENGAAKHVGRWSRVDYDRGASTPFGSKTAIGDVWANLPKPSTNVVYQDLVGNITTSRLRKPNAHYRPVRLSFRFPLLGGWKNHFWYKYDVPLSFFATSSSRSSSSHRIKVPVFPTVNDKFTVRDLSVRVLLPEGATNIRAIDHPSVHFSTRHTTEKTTLNYFGRTVVTLATANFYTGATTHDKHVVIEYDFNPTYLLAAPIIVAIGIFTLFLSVIVYAGSDMNLVPDQDNPALCASMLVTDQCLRIASAIRAIDTDHGELDALFSAVGSKAPGDLSTKRMEIESNLKVRELEIASAASELKGIATNKADIASALKQRFALKRDLCMRAFSSRIMVIEGRMSAEKYRKQVEEGIAADLTVVVEELERLAEASTMNL